MNFTIGAFAGFCGGVIAGFWVGVATTLVAVAATVPEVRVPDRIPDALLVDR